MEKYTDVIHLINYLNTELDSLYHSASLKLGMSDSVSIVLYSLCDLGNGCLLSDIYKNSGISKQTVNSAVRKLEADEIIYLELSDGKKKKVLLTDKGKGYIEETAARIRRAETDAFGSWLEEDVRTYIRLMEKYNDCFREQIKKL